MASNPPGECCIKGVMHEGSPTGKMIKFGGKWDAYVATPPADKAHKGVGLVLLPDVIGIWVNSQLIADALATNGYTTLIPDLFNGDALTLDRPAGFDFVMWLTQGSTGNNPHTTKQVDPICEAAIKTLKDNYGITKLGGLGYCFGAKYVTRHYKTGVQVGYIAHPSFVDEEELAAITGPLTIAAAETDVIFPAEKRHKSEEILIKTGYPWQINLYSGTVHGFACRADLSVKAQRFAKDQAFYQAVAWFNEWLLD